MGTIKIMTISRIIFIIILLYGTYTETGPWTTLTFFLLFLEFESLVFILKKKKIIEKKQ
jgi:hypothetical protein